MHERFISTTNPFKREQKNPQLLFTKGLLLPRLNQIPPQPLQMHPGLQQSPLHRPEPIRGVPGQSLHLRHQGPLHKGHPQLQRGHQTQPQVSQRLLVPRRSQVLVARVHLRDRRPHRGHRPRPDVCPRLF